MQPEYDKLRTAGVSLLAAAVSFANLSLPNRDSHPASNSTSYVSTALTTPDKTFSLQNKLGDSADCKSEINVPNAIKTIYIIREFHPDRNSLPTNLYKETINLQRGIADIAKTAADELGVKGVYKDGVTSKSISDIQKQEDFGKTLTDQEKKILDSDDPVSLIKGLYKSAKNDQEKQRALDLYTYGAYTEAVRHEATTTLSKKGIELLETEGVQEINAAKSSAIDNGPDSSQFKLTSEKREEFILNKVMESPDTSALIIIGYNHDFSNQVAGYNQRHPNAPVKLVVINPKGIDDLAQKILEK